MSLDRFRSVDIRIDKADHYFMSSQFAKGGDYNGRTLVVQITNGGLIESQAGITVNLGWRHESVKNSGLDPFEVVDAAQGIFEISYPREMLNPGRVTAVIQIIDGETITETKNFVIQVEKSPIDETSIVSSNSFTVLQEALIKVNSWNARIDAVEADFIERANNLDAIYPIELNSVKQQLEQTDREARRKKEPEDLSERSIALMTGTGTINLLSIPQNNSVDASKMAEQHQMITDQNKNLSTLLTGRTITEPYQLATSNNTGYFIATVTLPADGTLRVYAPTLTAGQAALFLTADGNAIEPFLSRAEVLEIGHVKGNWLSVHEGYYLIKIDEFRKAYPTIDKAVLGFNTADLSTAYANGIKTSKLSQFEWLLNDFNFDVSMIPEKSIAPAKLKRNFDYFNASLAQYGKRIGGYTPPQSVPALSNDSAYFVYTMDLPKSGVINIFKSAITSGQSFLLMNAAGQAFLNVGATSTNTTTLGENAIRSWLVVHDNYFSLDISNIKARYPDTTKIIFAFLVSQQDAVYINGVGTEPIEWLQQPAVTPNGKKIILPKLYPVVTGRQMNIYLDNVLKNDDYYKSEKVVVEGKSGVIAGGYQFEGVAADEVLTITKYEGNRSLLSNSLTVKAIPQTAGSGVTKKIMMIGESTTDNTHVVPELVNLFGSDVMNAEFIGTRGTVPANHESQSGWGTDAFVNLQTFKEKNNNFYNPDTGKFDYAYYMNLNGFTVVDYVAFILGINDASFKVTPETFVANLQYMIDSVRLFNPDAKIFIGLSNLPTKFENYNLGALRDRILAYIEKVIEVYSGRENEGYFIAPVYLNIDPLWDMPNTTQAVSQRNTKTITVGTNNVHPLPAGYYKASDVHFSTFKYAASLEG